MILTLELKFLKAYLLNITAAKYKILEFARKTILSLKDLSRRVPPLCLSVLVQLPSD